MNNPMLSPEQRKRCAETCRPLNPETNRWATHDGEVVVERLHKTYMYDEVNGTDHWVRAGVYQSWEPRCSLHDKDALTRKVAQEIEKQKAGLSVDDEYLDKAVYRLQNMESRFVEAIATNDTDSLQLILIELLGEE